jgi:murein DD-endopeptidase MepM/ murein hydrolase activator NlpD
MIRITTIKPFGGNFPMTSPFGERIDPKLGIKKMHNGVDFGCPEGTPIRAVLDGKIIAAGWESDIDHSQGYGRRIWIESHYNNSIILVVYAHLSQINKWIGEFAPESSIVGLSGNSGKSTGPHFHLGARIRDTNQFLDWQFEDTPETKIIIEGEITKPWSMADEVKNGQ